jgi:hypothetical protein
MVAGELRDCEKMPCLYYSSVRHVYAETEEGAREKIRPLLGHKWSAFELGPAQGNYKEVSGDVQDREIETEDSSAHRLPAD